MTAHLNRFRWWLAKAISPYDRICLNMTFDRTSDAVLNIPIDGHQTVVEGCTFVWPKMIRDIHA